MIPALSLSLCFWYSRPLIVFDPLLDLLHMFMSLLYSGIKFTQKFTGSSFGCKTGVSGELNFILPSFDKKCRCPWRVHAWLNRIESSLCEGLQTHTCDKHVRQVWLLIRREIFCICNCNNYQITLKEDIQISLFHLGVHPSLTHTLHESRRMMVKKQEKALHLCSSNYCFYSQLVLEVSC